MATENSPFSPLLTDTEKGLRREGLEIQDMDNLSESQQDAVRQITDGIQQKDITDQVLDLTRSVGEVASILGGIYSDTIQFDVDEQTGATKMDVKPEFQGGAGEGETDLGEAEFEYQVYQRKANDEDDNPVYGFDWVRAAP